MQAALKRPEIANIFTTYRSNVPQRRLNINRDKALKAGVQLNDLYTTISAFLGEPTLTISTDLDGYIKPTCKRLLNIARMGINWTCIS